VYLAEKIDRKLLTLEDRWKGRMRKSTIIAQLQAALKPFGVMVLWERNSKLQPNNKWIKGFFYWNRRHQPVELVIEFSTESPYYDWDAIQGRVKRTLFYISQTVQHELIHKSQNQRRNPDTYTHDLYMPINHRKTGAAKSQIEYLSLFDEIDSYGHDIAMEICYHYPKQDPFEVLKNIKKYKLLKSYRYYVRTFAGTNWEVIHDRLIKKIHGWLPYVTVMEKR
jgi:CYTH domain-containing protein